MKSLQAFLVITTLLFGCSHKENKKQTAKAAPVSEIPTLAEAYEFGMPLVLMDLMKENATNVNKPDKVQGRAPKNQFSHLSPITTNNFKTFLRPDTNAYYSLAWLDLSAGPVVLETPDTDGRYYSMPLMDAWGNVYASVGKRTTGTFPNRYLIVGPHWNGTIPSGIQAIKAPTEISWIRSSMLTDLKTNKTATNKIQQGFKLYPYRVSDQKYVAPQGAVDPMIQAAPASNKLFTMTTADYFNRLNRLMMTNPPSAEDKAILSKVSKFGIAPGAAFNPEALSEADQAELAKLPSMMKNKFDNYQVASSEGAAQASAPVVAQAPAGAQAAQPAPVQGAGWIKFKSPAELKNNYAARAFAAYQGVVMEMPEDLVGAVATRDDQGSKLEGSKHYILHFNKDQLPKVNERWTLTIYDSQGMIVKNKLNRFSLGSKNTMTYNSDGSLDIFIESDSPGKLREANWLPSPKGNFQVMARLYSPKQEALAPEYSLPPITEAGKTQSISLFRDEN